MIHTGKHLNRRTLLKGIGTAIALPMLDAMAPAFAAPARIPKTATRMAFVYVPNGITMADWTPKIEGKNFEITRILKPLEAYREDMLVLTGLAHHTGEGGNGDHARAGGTYLTGVRPKRTTGADVELGPSVDQLAAQAVGSQTRFASLELGCEATRTVGSCDAGYSCVYENSMSWRSATTPMPTEVNPRLVFERMYGSLDTNMDPATRSALEADRKSVLDRVNDRTHKLMGSLGPSDRHKIDEYLTALREIESRIQGVETKNSQAAPQMAKPDGIPESFPEHARLMQDLMVLAFQSDLTRVSTLMYAREGSNRVYPELGFTDSHHPITHHRYIPELVEKVTKINTHHVESFAYLIGRLKSIPDGDGTLLDHSMIVYGSSLSDGNRHAHVNLPTIVMGKGDGKIETGRHIVYPDTPLTNLFLSLLDRIGADAEKLGDSTGKLARLTGV